MNAKVSDLMATRVMATTPSQTVGRVREVMKKHGIHCMPVLDPEGHPLGIVTSTDVLHESKIGRPVGDIMSRNVYTIPEYSDPSLAARIMRNHGLHHVLVTNEKKIVGVVSSFDLLELVEDHRFVQKGAPTHGKRAGSRKRSEQL